MKNSPETRHKLMALLMISSHVLLTAFVVYWLIGQYREERTQLHVQLTQEYYQVHDQLVDSMLLKHLVLPSLDDSLRMEVSLTESDIYETEPDTTSTVVMMKQFFVEVPEEEDMLAIHLGTSDASDTGTRHHVTTVISDEERMVKSVRLFIDENPDAFRNDTGLHVFAMNLDSSALVLNLKGALEERKWKFELRWSDEEPGIEEVARLHGILLNGGSNRYLPALQVHQIGTYLIRSILPQMLFGLVLLLLSGSALLFAYMSLRKQLALNRLRNDFVGNISHELKTPVSTVKIALEALQNYDMYKDPKVSGEYLEMAASELGRLERLVAKVLHHEMLDNPSLVLEKEDCDLGELAQNVVRTLDIPIRETGARVVVSGADKHYRVLADRIYVEGIIMNLLDNSLKYSGANPEILLQIEYSPSGILLSVSDKGPGIPAEYKDQVFEKFFRIPEGNKHNVKGYGLGLNFASQVMAQHGGRISFSNLPEGGCQFVLHFPLTEA